MSAGGDSIGSHSAAVDDKGGLYTWGNGKLCWHIDSAPTTNDTIGDDRTKTAINGIAQAAHAVHSAPVGPVSSPRSVDSFRVSHNPICLSY